MMIFHYAVMGFTSLSHKQKLSQVKSDDDLKEL